MKLDPRPYLWGLARTTVDMLDFLVEAFDPKDDEEDPETTTGGWYSRTEY
jgi:hypothetical protein